MSDIRQQLTELVRGSECWHPDNLTAAVDAILEQFVVVPRSDITAMEYGVRQYRKDRCSWFVETASSREGAIAGARREWYDDDFEGRPRAYAVERPVLPAAQWAALTEDGDR